MRDVINVGHFRWPLLYPVGTESTIRIALGAFEGLRHELLNVLGTFYLLREDACFPWLLFLLIVFHWCWTAVQNHIFQSIICFYFVIFILFFEVLDFTPDWFLWPFLNHELRLSPIQKFEGLLRSSCVMLLDGFVVSSLRVIHCADMLFRLQSECWTWPQFSEWSVLLWLERCWWIFISDLMIYHQFFLRNYKIAQGIGLFRQLSRNFRWLCTPYPLLLWQVALKIGNIPLIW